MGGTTTCDATPVHVPYATFRHRVEHVSERANTCYGVHIRSNRIYTDGALQSRKF